MKIFLFFVALALICCLFFNRHVSAHVLKDDRNIGAVLHIDPDDNPVVNQPAGFNLYFQDISGKFSLNNCTCKLKLTDDAGQTIFSQALELRTSTYSQNPYTFGKEGVYTLNVTGQPNQSHSFQSFSLTYLVRVESATGTNLSFHLNLPLVAGFLMLQALALLATYVKLF